MYTGMRSDGQKAIKNCGLVQLQGKVMCTCEIAKKDSCNHNKLEDGSIKMS